MSTPPPTVSAVSNGLIGESVRITGDVFSVEALQVNGEVDGSLELENGLTIGPKGKATASIRAKEVIVFGSVLGNVEAVERIVLRNGANLVGDVKTAGIVIEDGAYFKGGIDIVRPDGSPKPEVRPLAYDNAMGAKR